MRLINRYCFSIGTKIPYSDWPEIVHQYLDRQGLSFHRFMYHFKDLFNFYETVDEKWSHGSCAKAVRDCPALGDIHFLNSSAYGSFDALWLGNIDSETACTEADLLPLMKKIHRRYGFSETNLYYYDIDFFHDVIPFARDMSKAEHFAARKHLDLEPALFLSEQPYGSGIQLYRDITGQSYLLLTIDVLRNGEILDPAPYVEAMKDLLPKIRHEVSQKIYLTEGEKREIALLNERAEPVLEQCRTFFSERLSTKIWQNSFSSKYNIAPKLKKLAKQYGFSYQYKGRRIYTLEKRSAGGHVLLLEADSGPSHYDTSFSLNFQGIGYDHRLLASMQTPTSQEELDACAERVLAVISEWEKALLPALDAVYPETPGWFIPVF